MNRYVLLKVSILFIAPLILGCSKNDNPESKETRSFYMGFTSFPYDFTKEARLYTYDKVNQYSDLIAFHFDNGIPWNEALNNNAYPQNILDDLSEKKSSIKQGHKVYVSVAPLGSNRASLALYKNTYDNQPLMSPWNTLSFNDTAVITAYLNYCYLLIDKLNPDYFNYGIESNSENWAAENFEKYKFFCSKIYSAIKNKYPNIKLMVSMMVNDDEKCYNYASALMPYSDIIALSIYPFIYIGSPSYGDANPDNFPADWISKMSSLDTDKKIGITETGYIAEDLNLSDFGITKHGTENWQTKYVSKLLKECDDLQTEFVVYWQIRDYDLGWAFLNSIGIKDQATAAWKDIGLFDGDGNVRTSLNAWNDWLKKKHN